MNIQLLITQYEEKAILLEVMTKEKEVLVNVKDLILHKSLVKTVNDFKTLQKDMLKYLGQFSEKLNKANVILAFGLATEEKE